MLQSLNTGATGMNAFQRGLEFVGKDMANVNTTGYKAQRVEYHDNFYDKLNTAVYAGNTPQTTTTGKQTGMGVDGSVTSTDFSQGTLQTTGVFTDVAIVGKGFFRVENATGSAEPETLYTRAGNFSLDNQGYLVTKEGFYVQGLTSSGNVSMTAAGTTDGQGVAADSFNVVGANIANPGPNGALTSGLLTLPAGFNGGSGYLNTTFGKPKITILGDGSGATAEAVIENGTITGINITGGGKGYNQAIVQIQRPPVSDIEYKLAAAPTLGEVGRIRITEPTIGLTLTNGATPAITQAGALAGAPTMESYAINENGQVQISLTNGESVTVGQLLLQDFFNPQELNHSNGTYFSNEGAQAREMFTFAEGIPGGATNGLGFMRQGQLELSNSNLTRNFGELITTQRSFQGASRIVTVSDEMLQEVARLKS